VVNAATEEFVTSIPFEGSGVHSVAVNAKNGHIFVPVNGGHLRNRTGQMNREIT